MAKTIIGRIKKFEKLLLEPGLNCTSLENSLLGAKANTRKTFGKRQNVFQRNLTIYETCNIRDHPFSTNIKFSEKLTFLTD